jgi:hypothetical protein
VNWDFEIRRLWARLEEGERWLARGCSSCGDTRYTSLGHPAGQSIMLTWEEEMSRVQRVRQALFDSGPLAERMIAERLAGIDFTTVWPILIQAVQDIALILGGSVALGTVSGAAVGALFGGVATLPGAVAGASLGGGVGGWVLALLGLKSLAEGLVDTLPEAASCYREGVLQAWGETHWEREYCSDVTRNGNLYFAAAKIARGHVILLTALLMAMVAYLTRGKGSRGQLLKEIRESRWLGPKVATWMEKNEKLLVEHPSLKTRERPRAASEEPPSRAMTPNQMKKAMEEDVAKRQASRKEASEAEKLPGAEEEAGAKSKNGGKSVGGERKVPCFHPFDKKKFGKMPADEQKAYLKEMAEQLKRQQDQINSLTTAEYKAARDAFAQRGRNPMAEGAQASYREDFAKDVQENIRESLRRGGMGAAQAEAEAAARTKGVMSKLAALHEPDMVGGGWLQSAPKGMGRADVNSSIGSSWNQAGRVASMDTAADDAIWNGRGNEKMNVRLEPCRGKGLK